jgi:hypothetical protein
MTEGSQGCKQLERPATGSPEHPVGPPETPLRPNPLLCGGGPRLLSGRSRGAWNRVELHGPIVHGHLADGVLRVHRSGSIVIRGWATFLRHLLLPAPEGRN